MLRYLQRLYNAPGNDYSQDQRLLLLKSYIHADYTSINSPNCSTQCLYIEAIVTDCAADKTFERALAGSPFLGTKAPRIPCIDFIRGYAG